MSFASWLSSLKQSRHCNRKSARRFSPRASAHRAFVELLEDRRLLTVVVENSASSFGTNSYIEQARLSVPAGNDRAIAVMASGGVVVSSVSDLGGNLFKKAYEYGSGSIWIATLGTSTTATTETVTATFTGAAALKGIAVLALSGVNQSVPTTSKVSGSAGGTFNLSYNVPSKPGDLVVDSVYVWKVYDPAVLTVVGAGQTRDMFGAPYQGRPVPWNGQFSFGASHAPGADAVNMSWQAGASQWAPNWSRLAVNIQQSVSSNSPPAVIANTAAVSANEGGTLSNTGTFSDQNGNSTVTLSASIGTVTQNNTNGTWSWSHNVADGPASGTVTITARDNQNAAATATFSYSVNNIAPTISLSGNATVDEGSPYTLNLGVVTDPGQDTITSYKINWGDGVIDSFTGNPANTTATHTYADGPNNQTHRVTVTDEDGTVVAGELSVLVLNVAPTIAIKGAASVQEGSPYSLIVGAISDPGTDTVSDYSIDWGDGIVENFSGNPANSSKTHTYADGANTYRIRVSLTDEDGTHADAASLSVLVNNVAPTFEAGADETVQPTQLGAFSRSGIGITDPGSPETFSGTVNFGDGTGDQALTINQAARQFNLSHTYPNTNAAPAVATYRVTVTVNDGDRGSHTDSFEVTVNLNTPPVAEDDSVTTDEDQGFTFNVLANDHDNQNNIVPNLTSPAAGVLTNNGDGTFSYNPNGACESLAVGESATVSFDYQVVDAFGETDIGTVTITITGVNDGPSVSVGRNSVTVNEGQTASNSGSWSDIDASDVVTLSASVGTVTKNADGTWNWSFNTNDGPDQSQTVTITANDGNGGIATTTFALTVNNVAPDAVNDNYSTSQATLLTGNVIAGGGADTDPAGANDPLTVAAVNGVASNVGQAIALSNGTLTVNANGFFSYQPDTTFVGTDSFTYTISDGDGGFDAATVTIVVNEAAGGSILTVVDTCCDGGTALLVRGTSANDLIVVTPGLTSATLQVTVNGVISAVAKLSGRIIVLGLAGNDNIQIAGAISNSVWLYGDEGDDRLNAGNVSPGGNLLFGGDGNDDLLGGNGRDILIGGQGADKITANADDDILIAGLTTHDARNSVAHEEFWCNVLHEWTELDPFATRVNRLRTGSGHTGVSLLASVLDDNSADQIDQLQGSSGNDWFLLNSGEDRITGQTEATN